MNLSTLVFVLTSMLAMGLSLTMAQIDLLEINEAFAAQVLGCLRAFASDDYCRRDDYFGLLYSSPRSRLATADDLICIAGSFFLAAELRHVIAGGYAQTMTEAMQQLYG